MMSEALYETDIPLVISTQETRVEAVNDAFDAIRDSEVSSGINELEDYIFELKAGLEYGDKISRMQKIQALMSAVVSLIELFDVEIGRLQEEADRHVIEKEEEKKNNVAIYAAIHFEESSDPTLQDELGKSLAVISQHSQAISEANSRRVIYQADRIKYDAYKASLELPYSIACEYARRLGVIAVEQAAIDLLPELLTIPVPPEMKNAQSSDAADPVEVKERPSYSGIDFSEFDIASGRQNAITTEYMSPKTTYVHIDVKIPEPIPQPEPEPAPEQKIESRTLPEILAMTDRPKLSIDVRLLSNKQSAQRLTSK